MYDIRAHYAEYDAILKSRLTGAWVFFAFGIFFVCVAVFTLWLWGSLIKEDAADADSPEKCKKVKIEKLQWAAFLLFSLWALTSMFVMTIHNIRTISYDRAHHAYAVIDDTFTVTCQQWFGRGQKDTYTLTFEKDGKTVEIHSEEPENALSVGTHTDTVVVYSLHSKIIVDTWQDGDT